MKKFLVLGLVLTFVFSAFGQNFVEVSTKKNAKARVSLAEVSNIKNADVLETANVPNYIKALAANTKAAPQFANLVQTFLYGGTISPETKMAMGLKVSQIYNSAYLFSHAQRWLKASEKGTTVLANLKSNKPLSDSEQTAIRYAELLTKDIHGITDAEFAKTRAFYNDSQIVELTMTVCFFNYFVRMVEALNLPTEDWVLTNNAKTPNIAAFEAPRARIGLVSDKELEAGNIALNSLKQTADPKQSLGVGIANSQRAMMRVPDLQAVWREFGTANRAGWTIDRNIQLQISFAVSMVNGCRYCTLHQVLGLRRLGVDPTKLLAMKKDDSALTPRELTAVEFARKLTKEPNSTTDADFAKLKNEFGEQGALEVIMQTGNFAFMNRFTDNLRLPSEDEAVKTYQEVYGEGTYKSDWKKP
ncbi:MAG: carboxymuconolactone decarboxylase family protein [Pyrinomonadaceae bacterium]|nr:carboxymuconolactone decarboxylase family protein [Pyrinomonadaceae bacterium]